MFSKERKVKVIVFDKDLRGETGKYPISSKGSMISIRRGGKRNFNPSFTETSHLDIPKALGRRERVYFVRSNASKCVDFKTLEVPGPDPKQIEEATKSSLIRNFGKEDKGVPWYAYVIMALQFLVVVLLV